MSPDCTRTPDTRQHSHYQIFQYRPQRVSHIFKCLLYPFLTDWVEPILHLHHGHVYVVSTNLSKKGTIDT